jgi:hypothetical protein
MPSSACRRPTRCSSQIRIAATKTSARLPIQPRKHRKIKPKFQGEIATGIRPSSRCFFVERLNFGKRLGLALRTLAEQDDGRVPPKVSSAAQWLSTNSIPIEGDTGPLYGVGTIHFEVVYKGRLRDLQDAAKIIMAREKNPVEVHPELWTRMYVFADGSVQRLESTTPDGFSARENELWPEQP